MMTDLNQDTFICTCGHDRIAHPNAKKCLKCDCGAFKAKSERAAEQLEGLKELGVVIEDKETAFWKELREKAVKLIADSEKEVKIHKAVLETCDRKIKELPDATYIG